MTMLVEPTPEQFESWRSRLRSEIVGVRDVRDQYLALFAHSPERIAILNFCAAWFFGTIRRVFLREIILGISRLTDPEATGQHANLVLRTLLRDPALRDRPEVASELAAAIQRAEDAAAGIRPHRHKYIAHLDHAVALADEGNDLPALLRRDVDDAITAIEKAYNVHNGRMREAHAEFSVSTTRGTEALMRCLETSDRWRIRAAMRSPQE